MPESVISHYYDSRNI